MIRRRRQKPEQVQQTHMELLLARVAYKTYRLATTRKQRCWKCGEVTKDQGTRQTPGLCDLISFLKAPGYKPGVPTVLFIEAKAPKGRPSDEQIEFREFALACGAQHVLGTLDALIAFLVDGGWIKAESLPHYRQSKETHDPVAS